MLEVLEGLTRVPHHLLSCGTSGSIPAQMFSANCPMSHFFFFEVD